MLSTRQEANPIRGLLGALRLPCPADGVPVLVTLGGAEPKPPPGVVVDLTRFRVSAWPEYGPQGIVVRHPDDGIYCAVSVSFGAEPTLAEIIAAFEKNPLLDRADIGEPVEGPVPVRGTGPEG